MSKSTNRRLEAYRVRQVAVAAMVDPRTVERAISGRPVRPIILARIVQALQANGLGHLAPPVK
jgi:hypothetical protein